MKTILGLLSPGGSRGRLTILILHRVLREPDPLFPDEMHAGRFDEMCGWLKNWFSVLPLDEGARRLRDGTLPPRAASITFDDGYADNEEVALPILQRHGLPATFFIATGFLDGGCMWNDIVIEAVRAYPGGAITLDSPLGGTHPVETAAQCRQLIDRVLGAIKHLAPEARLAAAMRIAGECGLHTVPSPMMRSGQVIALRRAGMQIGAHTVNHPILAVLDKADVQREIAQSKAHLEELINMPVTLFAYPNGKPVRDYDERSVEAVRQCGFDAAVSTAWGAARSSSDILQLPRFTPWDLTRLRFGLRLAANLVRPE